jgi:hypothetical protein
MAFNPGIDNSPMWQRPDFSQVNRLGDYIEKRREEAKREADQAAAADKFLKALPEDSRPAGLDPHSLKMMGGREKIAHMQGLIGAQSYQKGQEDLKLDLERRLTLAESLRGMQEQRANTARFPAFAQSLTDATAPSVGQMQDFYEGAPGVMPEESLRPQARPIGPRDFFQAIQSSGYNPGSETDSLLRSIEAGQPKSGGALGPDILAQFGMVPTGGQVNPNGSASLTFGMPPGPPPTGAVPILTTEGGPTGKATFGDKVIDLSPPNSEGKTLTQSETQMLGALDQAEQDLGNIEKLFQKLGPDWGGPISGRVKSTLSGGQNPNIAAVQNAITAATPNLARGVFREVGVLTDEDVKRYQALLPTAYDTDAVRKVKLDQLRERIREGRKETISNLRKAGRDLSGFEKPARSTELDRTPAAAVDELEAARAALKSGKNPEAVKKLFKQRTGQDFPE